MSMNVVAFDYEKHSAEVSRWGSQHSFPLPPKEMLPNTGFMVNETACGFLYSTNSSLAWLEWVFSNPEKSEHERQESLDILFQMIEATAKELDIKAVFSASAIPAYSKILLRNGFNETDKNVTHYIKMMGAN